MKKCLNETRVLQTEPRLFLPSGGEPVRGLEGMKKKGLMEPVKYSYCLFEQK